MKVTITTKVNSCQYIHDMLVDPVSGNGCLCGSKECIDDHIGVSDILEFDLNQDEINELQKDDNIVSVVYEEYTETKLDYVKTSQTGAPKLAYEDSPSNVISHHLHYCQNYDASFVNSTTNTALSSIDCSNVDVVVMDSGIDPTHSEFIDDQLNPQVVQFDWTQLTDDNSNQILASLPANYNQDINGHGTACASLIAGKRSGFAKNAKIYSLRCITDIGDTDGISVTDGLKLMLAFQKAKKNNLYGLNSSRPTVFSNSWSYLGRRMDPGYFTAINNTNYSSHFGYGHSDAQAHNPYAGAANSLTDGYFRQILDEGVHCLTSAGNENAYLSDDRVIIKAHIFSYNGNQWASLAVPSNYSSFVIGTAYTPNNQVYLGRADIYHNYRSPGIGFDNKNSNSNGTDVYPLITVGDVSPVGNITTNNFYSTSGQTKAAYNIASNLSSESRIKTDSSVRYNTLSGSFFVKSVYSSFGPNVDVYAPGNGAWVAKSNQSTTTASTMTADDGGVYQFFNGTSSACPIAAGCLATYLSEFPSSTPIQARDWLKENGIKGNIMETQESYITNNYTTDGIILSTINLPYGADINAIDKTYPSDFRFRVVDPVKWDQGDVEDLLFSCRLFNSNNIVVQAYPLRKAVLNSPNNSEEIASTTLAKNVASTENITHSI